MKTDLFQSCGHSEFSKFAGILSAALSQHHLLGFEIAQLEEKGMTVDEIAGWHHRLDGHEFEKALGVGEGQGETWCATVHGVAKSQT